MKYKIFYVASLLGVALPASASVISTALITAGIAAGKAALLAILVMLIAMSTAVFGGVMLYRFLHRHQVAVEHESNDENVIDIEAHDIHEVDGDAIIVDAMVIGEVVSEDADFVLTCSHCGQEWTSGELVDEGTLVSGGWFWGCPGCHEYNNNE